VYKLQFSADGSSVNGRRRGGDDEEAEEMQEIAYYLAAFGESKREDASLSLSLSLSLSRNTHANTLMISPVLWGCPCTANQKWYFVILFVATELLTMSPIYDFQLPFFFSKINK
jgi:hypothetical protein